MLPRRKSYMRLINGTNGKISKRHVLSGRKSSIALKCCIHRLSINAPYIAKTRRYMLKRFPYAIISAMHLMPLRSLPWRINTAIPVTGAKD